MKKNISTLAHYEHDRGFVDNSIYGRMVWWVSITRHNHTCCICGNDIKKGEMALRPSVRASIRKDRICRDCILKVATTDRDNYVERSRTAPWDRQLKAWADSAVRAVADIKSKFLVS